MTETTAPAMIPQTKPWENLFGVCAALGEDFGFNPLWLRIAFGAGLVFQPVGVVAAYIALGLVVLLSHRVAPAPKPAATPATAAVARIEPRAATRSDVSELPLAA